MERRELPEGWESINLGEAEKAGELIFQNGFACGCNNQDGRGIPQLRPMNVNHLGQIDLTALKFIEVDRNISNYILQKNDVVFNNTNSSELVGKTAVWKGKSDNYVLSNHMTIIRILKQSHIDPIFFSRYFHHLWTKRVFKNICQDHINQSSVSLERLREIEIPLPPLPVQRRIVEILDQADALRHLRAQADAETQKLLQSVFYEMFGDPVRNEKGWKRRKLGDVCIKIQDGTHYSPKDQNGDIPYITAKNIRFSGIDLTNVTYVPKSIHDNIYSRCDPKRGDVIYIKDGVTAGLAKVNNLDFEFSMLSSIAMIRPDSQKLNPYYLEYYLNHPNVYKKIMERKSGSAITRLILREIREIPIILPHLSLQNEFAKIVLNAEQIVTIQAMSRKEINCIISGLMTMAFSGELN